MLVCALETAAGGPLELHKRGGTSARKAIRVGITLVATGVHAGLLMMGNSGVIARLTSTVPGVLTITSVTLILVKTVELALTVQTPSLATAVSILLELPVNATLTNVWKHQTFVITEFA